jgi:hypothetical protein
MNKLTAFAVGIILVAGVISTARATTIYFDDGTVYELQENEAVYVSSGRVWEFTRFNPLDLRIEALVPLETEEAEQDCLGFGHTSCVEQSSQTETDD